MTEKFTGIDIAKELFSKGLTLEQVQGELRKMGYYAERYPPTETTLTVSLSPYEGEVHPRVTDVRLTNSQVPVIETEPE